MHMKIEIMTLLDSMNNHIQPTTRTHAHIKRKKRLQIAVQILRKKESIKNEKTMRLLSISDHYT